MRGEKVDIGLTLCPFKLVQSYPFRFVGRAKMDQVSSSFFQFAQAAQETRRYPNGSRPIYSMVEFGTCRFPDFSVFVASTAYFMCKGANRIVLGISFATHMNEEIP